MLYLIINSSNLNPSKKLDKKKEELSETECNLGKFTKLLNEIEGDYEKVKGLLEEHKNSKEEY